MTHHWWFGIYVAVALATFATSSLTMGRSARQWWVAKCHCCDERVALWHRLAAITVIVIAYPVRAALWPLIIPLEFVLLVREGLREREKQ